MLRDAVAAAPCWTGRTLSLEAANPVAYGKINHFLTGVHSTNSLGLAVSRRSFGPTNRTSAENWTKEPDVMMSRGANLQSIEEYSFKNMGLSATGDEPVRSENLKVLLIEDDEADVYLIKTALSENPRIGEIVLAQDGVEALELIDSGAVKPDLAIVDLHMPRKDGFALLLEFGARESVSFPSIVLTSSRSGADALRSRSRGADMYLVKPTTLGKLTALMDDVIATM